MNDKQCILVELVDVGKDRDDAPLGVRLRRWLKAALRVYRLRCKSISTEYPKDPAGEAGAPVDRRI